MHLLGPLLLLLEYVNFSSSDASLWKVHHPPVLYAWDGACVWIPCKYTIPANTLKLENLMVYHNHTYNTTTKEFTGTILYNSTLPSKKPESLELLDGQERVQFLGSDRSNCTLRIYPVNVSDTGVLGLRMMTKWDKWMENVTLNISQTAPPPCIELPPEIRENQTATLTCSLNTACYGYHIGLQWSLEEGSVVNSTDLTTDKVATQSKLTFWPQWTHHGRNVTCELWDHEKNQPLSKASVRLDVKHTPKLHVEVIPQDAVVKEKMQVTMTCQVISSNPQYQTVSWIKIGEQQNKQEMEGKHEKLTLTLSTVSKDMGGQYQCIASNALGTGESKKVTLQVHYPPEPSKVQISPLLVKEGDEVNLTCLSPANPPPTNFSWFHNERALPGRNKMLQIKRANLSHAGTYSCQAENVLGCGKKGQKAQLDVQYPPKEVRAVIQSPPWIREGDTVTVWCKYNSSNPTVTRYEWKYSNHQDNSAVLRIHNIAWNAKPVTCAACNQWCSWAPEVNLQVQYAPRNVTMWLSTQPVVRSGSKLQLSCRFSSSRPAAVLIRWKKNGILLREGPELHFDAIAPEDAGTYHCEVNNSVGQTQSLAQEVSVEYPPRRLQVSFAPKGGVVEGRKAVLRCESDANPPVKFYSWFDGNNQNLNHNEQTLRLEPVKTQHSGAYWCQGTNELGVGQSPPAILTVYYSSETIAKRTALGLGVCLTIFFLVIWSIKYQQSRKRIQSQQELQENPSGQSFFVRNKKVGWEEEEPLTYLASVEEYSEGVGRTPLVEGPSSLGCYNPVMEEATNYAILSFPNTPRNKGTSETQRPSPHWDDTVTYSVVQKRPVADYENVTPGTPEDEGIHYSELVHFGGGSRSPAPDPVEYVTLKH